MKKLKDVNMFLKNIIFFILIFIPVFLMSSAYNIYSFSQVNEITNADAAVILGASVWNNKPSPVFQERINHGIWLYKNGYVKHLIFTGGIGKNSNVSEASVAMSNAIENSVSIENIFIEEYSRITLENIRNAKNIIEDNNFNKIIIVSDPIHMKRAITMAKDFNLNVFSSLTPTTRYISMKTKINFLFYEVFFYATYKIYKYSLVIFLYTVLFTILFLIYYAQIFRHNCA
jgi:uncharacterized SAM-binding protein YcdF (DUF218 family)